MKVSFPSDFFWGVAASAPQTEGAARGYGKGLSIWDYWSHNEPDKFWQQAKPDIAADFYHKYRDDVAKSAFYALEVNRANSDLAGYFQY